jgi:hypothetical protein
MTSKLALHHNSGRERERLAEFYRLTKPAVALHLDLGDTEFPQMISEMSPDTIVVSRKWFSSQPLNDPEGRADSAVRSILDTACGRAGLITHAVIYNEIGPHPTHDYMQFDIRATQRLHEAGIKAGVGSWSVGTPDVPDWSSSWFTETLRHADFLSLHEYCAPTMNDPRGLDGDEGWFTLRYKKMMRALREQNLDFPIPPIIFTECGIDSGAAHWDPGALGGWRSFTNAQGYMDQLAWYDGHLQASPEVLGACIFQVGDISGDWGSFEVLGEMLDVLQNYMVQQQDIVIPYPDWLIDMRATLPRTGEYPVREGGLGAVRRVVIHHSDVAPTVGPWQIAEYHVGIKGWPGHGYHADVAVDGRVWHCQDWDRHSYHAGDANGDSIGVCLLGSFMDGNEPPEPQLAATRKLIAHLEQVVGHSLEVAGHREVVADRDCPGDTFLGTDGWKQRLLEDVPPEPDWEEKYNESQAEVGRLSNLLAEIEETAKER